MHGAIEGNMTDVKGTGRRRTHIMDDFRNRKSYGELKEGEMEKTVYQ
jgi:hypothetical protein